MELTCQETWVVKSVLVLLNVSIAYDETVLCTSPTTMSRKVNLWEHRNKTHLYSVRTHNILTSIVDLMLYWKRFQGGFIYDEYSGINTELVFGYLKKRAITAEMFPLAPHDNVESVALKATEMQTNIIIICHYNLTNEIIRKLKSYEAFQRNFTWIIAGEDIPDELRNIDIPPVTQVTLVSPRIKKNLRTFTKPRSGWLLQPSIIKKWLTCNMTRPNHQSVQLYLEQKDKYSTMLRIASTIEIFDVFFSLESRRTESVKFAQWLESTKLFMLETLDSRDRKRRLSGRRIRMTVFPHKPYNFLDWSNGTLHVTGYLQELFDMIMDTLNIRYSLTEMEEVFGVNSNGTFSGMVGRLQRREADIGMNVLAITNGRAKGVRYAGPITKAYLTIIYNRPDPFIPPTTYLLPFTLPVWIYICATMVIVVVSIFAVMILSPFSRQYETQSEKMHTIVFRLMTLTFLEEVITYPPGLPSKIVYGTLLMAVLATFAHYTSIFTSFLAYQEEKIPFRSLQDVVANKEYMVLMVKNGRHQDMFQNAHSGPYKQVWERIQWQGEISFEKSFESGLMKSYTGKYSYLSDGPTCMFISNGNCSVAFAPVKYMEEFYNMAHRLDFPYTRMFTKSLINIMEGGVFRRLTKAYSLDSRPPCHYSSGNVSFGLNQVIGVFFIYACGLILSLILLTIENCIPLHWTLHSLSLNAPPS